MSERLIGIAPPIAALFIIISGFAFLYFARADHDHELEAIVAGFVGASMQFLFASQVAHRRE